MDCIILAGGRVKPSDPLYKYTHGKPKALIDLGGRTLIEHVVEALEESSYVDDIAVVGIGSEYQVTSRKQLYRIADQGSIVANGLAGAAWARERRPDSLTFMVSTADIPAINGQIVDGLVEACHPFDNMAYYSFVTRKTIDDRFPGANRTYSKIDGEDVAGCDVLIARWELIDADQSLWQALANSRKQPWKLAQLVGARVLVKFLAGQLTLAEVETVAQRVLGGPVKILISSHAELAMDIDKPSHVEILRAEFEETTNSS